MNQNKDTMKINVKLGQNKTGKENKNKNEIKK